MEKHTQHDQARNLFLQTELSNQQIAELLDISRNTITRWIKQEQWREMKYAATQAPGAVLLELYDQLTALNRNISSREPHLRFPTKEEALIQRRLMMTIKSTERQHPGNYMQTYSELIDELKYEDPELAKKIMTYSQNIVQRKLKRDKKFNAQQYMFLEDEIEESTEQNNTDPNSQSLIINSSKEQTCTIEKNNILCHNQTLTQILPTSMVQQNSSPNAPLQTKDIFDAQPSEQEVINTTSPEPVNSSSLGGGREEVFEQYKNLGYEKPTDNRSGLFFAQKRFGRITVKYGRIHPQRDQDMIDYFDNLFNNWDN